MLSDREMVYVKAIFEWNKGCNEFTLVNNVMQNKNLIEMYHNNGGSEKDSIYDYMLWLRKLRKEIYPDCEYIITRRKTPKCEHGFRDMKLYEYYNKGF